MKRCANLKYKGRAPCGRTCADDQRFCNLCRAAKERAAKRRQT